MAHSQSIAMHTPMLGSLPNSQMDISSALSALSSLPTLLRPFPFFGIPGFGGSLQTNPFLQMPKFGDSASSLLSLSQPQSLSTPLVSLSSPSECVSTLVPSSFDDKESSGESTPKKIKIEVETSAFSPNSNSESNVSGSQISSPQGSPTRKIAQPIPSEKKDAAYFERRRKNNDAAKRSRDLRRKKEEAVSNKATILEQENMQLRSQIALLKNETAKLQLLLFSTTQKPVDSSSQSEVSAVIR